MGVAFKDVNFNELVNKLAPCCLEEETCSTCTKEKCLIGYGKECIKGCLKNKVTYVENGYGNIPIADTKLYDKDYVITAIADILKRCKSCQENHYDNCIINVLRNCYEISLFGEGQEYQGSAFMYLNGLKSVNEEIADKIFAKYSEK
ncbi:MULTISPECIES: hypothetical protein [Clostridium]|uniref:Uncharacterized protein n=1 Tax=Clostridium botulinum TaxID=1491 RepID=A0A6B4JH69_CLOBO|nr:MULTISPECIES: hypothetical protein [Clostridium]EES49844.1 conserved hypothetical protein [Clostridium botulinum E1 str. 'BoNT E Beluga']MBN1036655.1 hypothetical protein [Clostridium botulinum]MBN1043348.1 hypothetical protein [Clostridium botulinum]MBN1072347.1 hypothetical protein [Clostridium botulinum]MBY6759514.1 hypothetical protein [Clostridium botulinum]